MAPAAGGAPPWLDRVAVPLAVFSADGLMLVATNAPGRRLLAADGAGPRRVEAVIGADAALVLQAHLRAAPVGGPDDWLVMRCETAAGARRLAVSVKRCDAGWLATLFDHFDVPDADAPGVGDLAWQQNLSALANWLPIGIEIYDADFRELFANAHSHRVFDYGGAYFGHHDDWWELGFPDPVARATAYEEWQEKVRQARARPGQVQQSEWQVRCSDGTDRCLQFRYRFLDDFYVVVFWDVTQQRQIEAELQRHAGTDILTGLPNRRRLIEIARTMMQAPPLALLMVDLDHFKAINDRFGHAVGDQALQAAAERCRRMLRDSDVIARVGGEEFAVLLPGTEHATAAAVAERLREAVGCAPLVIGDRQIDLTASIGATLVGPAETELDAVLHRADRALYAAKAGGRNRVEFSTPGPEQP
jgi:diguanylate cyclase (GGDEF)-like protein